MVFNLISSSTKRERSTVMALYLPPFPSNLVLIFLLCTFSQPGRSSLFFFVLFCSHVLLGKNLAFAKLGAIATSVSIVTSVVPAVPASEVGFVSVIVSLPVTSATVASTVSVSSSFFPAIALTFT